MVKTGLELFVAEEYKRFRKLRLGILCNQASVDKHLLHASHLILKREQLTVTCLIGPQHGIRGEKQDNMVESQDFIDPVTKLPVYSLYGETREPNTKLLNAIDAFVIDLQDIGTRIYTFMYTMANCMRAAKRANKKIIVLDRPNPIDGKRIEGNVLDPLFTSFVGQFPICTRHGMTMGELALLFNDGFSIGCDLEVIALKGWKRNDAADTWGRDWVPPSPNIPTLTSALVFPGMVHFEGTNISEGRGTTKPFEWIGAPFIEPDRVAAILNKKKLGGVYFRPIFFQPTYQKWKDEVCGGVQVHVENPKKFNSFEAGIHLLAVIAELYPEKFQWKKPPYEYENEKMPIDLIAGTSELRKVIDERSGLKDFLNESEDELAAFKRLRAQYLIY